MTGKNRRWYFVRPMTTAGIRVVLTCDSLLIVGTHWTGERTILHREETRCEGCLWHKGLRPVGYGSCLAWDQDGSYPAAVELTAVAARQLVDQAGPRGTLRGLVVHLKRRRPGKSAPMDAIIEREYDRDLPGEVDLGDRLRAMWSVPEGEELIEVPLWGEGQ